jgi:hypothetical protein
MSWTKQQFVDAAFDELGLSSFVADIDAIQSAAALKKLDAMLATWNAQGIRIGYPIPSTPENSNLADETNVPDAANEAIYQNLAVRLGPSYGKVVPTETKSAAKMAYTSLLSRFIQVVEFQLPGDMPAGAGLKRISEVFIDPPGDPLLNGPDSELEF